MVYNAIKRYRDTCSGQDSSWMDRLIPATTLEHCNKIRCQFKQKCRSIQAISKFLKIFLFVAENCQKAAKVKKLQLIFKQP